MPTANFTNDSLAEIQNPPFRSIDLDETEEAVNAGPGRVYGWLITNNGSADVFVKWYDGLVADVVVGTTTPYMTFKLEAGGKTELSLHKGIPFEDGITIAATTGVADNDTGAPGANEVIANIWFIPKKKFRRDS